MIEWTFQVGLIWIQPAGFCVAYDDEMFDLESPAILALGPVFGAPVWEKFSMLQPFVPRYTYRSIKGSILLTPFASGLRAGKCDGQMGRNKSPGAFSEPHTYLMGMTRSENHTSARNASYRPVCLGGSFSFSGQGGAPARAGAGCAAS